MGIFDCLRQKKIQARIDSSWYYNSQTGIWSFMNTFRDTSILYDWLSNDATTGFILAEISYMQSSNTYSGAYWMKGTVAGIEDYQNDEIISLYPNPASNFLFVKTKHAGILELRDVNGRILKSEELKVEIQIINVSDFSAGIYLLTLIDTENKFLPVKAKVIVER
jgi:hypothetical protein